jgi:glutathione S-transferase
MPFRYVPLEQAMSAPGLRMVVVGGVPSPWGEAAKGILHIKGIEWLAVKLDYESAAMKEWTGGQRSGPVAIYEGERPRAGWAEILLLAERLAPKPSLLPADAAERALMFGLSHEICGESGLAWSQRLHSIHAGLQGRGGFPPPVAKYLGRKYGYRPEAAAAAATRVEELLAMLAARLAAQRKAGSPYYIGGTVTALDVYSATAMAMFSPLPPEQCPMDATTRAVFENPGVTCDPILLEHRNMMYARHLALPLSL